MHVHPERNASSRRGLLARALLRLRRRHANAEDRGLAMVEVVVVMGLIGIVVMGFMVSSATVNKVQRANQLTNVSDQLAQSVLEQARAYPPSGLGLRAAPGTPAGAEPVVIAPGTAPSGAPDPQWLTRERVDSKEIGRRAGSGSRKVDFQIKLAITWVAPTTNAPTLTSACSPATFATKRVKVTVSYLEAGTGSKTNTKIYSTLITPSLADRAPRKVSTTYLQPTTACEIPEGGTP